METRGLFKRIAAITMAALTIVTSSGVDVNLLTANANELTKQATENAVDKNTNNALQKKDANVGAQAKLSFSTNEALKRAVDDAGFNIDVKTNKVTSAAIKYNQSLLTLGKDFTATAKRTSYTKNGSKYNYVFTVTVIGKGDYTGSTTRTGVTQVSDIKPATAKKSAASTKKKSTKKNSPKKATPQSDGTYDAGAIGSNGRTVSDTGEKAGGWHITFNDANIVQDRLTYIYYGNPINPQPTVTNDNYPSLKTSDYTVKWVYNGQANETPGRNKGHVIISATGNFLLTLKNKNVATQITCCFDIVESVTRVKNGYGSICLVEENKDALEERNRNEHKVNFHKEGDKYADGVGYADGDFEYNGSIVQPKVAVYGGTNLAGEEEWDVITTTQSESGQIVKYYDQDDKDKISKVGDYASHLRIRLGKNYGNEEVDIYYNVVARSVKNSAIKVGDISDEVYTGKPITPSVTVTDDNSTNTDKKLQEAEKGVDGKYIDADNNGIPDKGDYWVSYSNNTDVGTATVTVHGINNYTNTVSGTFKITPQDAADTTKNKVKAEVTGSAVYTGAPLEPEITVTDQNIEIETDDQNQTIYKTLVEGTDYTVAYHNNTAVYTTKEGSITDKNKDTAPYATLTFKGNYKGTINLPFAISAAKINSKGFSVRIDNNTAYTFATDGTSGEEVNSIYSPLFDPVADDIPDITVYDANGNPLKKLVDYNITNVTSDQTTPAKVTPQYKGTESGITWPKATSNWQLKVEGANSYNGSSFILNFSVAPLPLSDSHISVSNYKRDSDGNPDVTVKYASDSRQTKTLKKGTDYTVGGVPGTGEKVTITLKGVDGGNYTDGDQTVQAGISLSKLSTDKAADLRITYYDPYTGALINTTGMQYYGKGVWPHIEIEKKDGSSYTRLTENADFIVSEVTSADKTVSGAGSKGVRHYLKITQGPNSTEVYGTAYVYYYTTKYSFSPTTRDLAAAFSYKLKDRTKNLSDVTAEDIQVDFNPYEMFVITHNTSSDGKITPDVKVRTLASDTTGSTQSKYSIATDDNGTEHVQVSIQDPYKTGDSSNIKWNVPGGNVETLTPGTDYDISTASTPSSPLNGGEVKLVGKGDNFENSAIIKLGTPGITTSDFEVRYNGKKVENNQLDDITFDQKNQMPEVELYQISTDKTLTPKKNSTDKNYAYTVTYTNPEGKTATLDQKDSTTEDFKETGTYTITLDADTGENSAYRGKITITYRIVPRSGIEARFNKGQTNPIKYQGDDTPTPRIQTSDKGSGPVLKVYDGKKELTYDTDYTVKETVSSDDSYFKTPGKKVVTIQGKGDYEGVNFASDQYGTSGYYYVKADLGQLQSKDSKGNNLYNVRVNGEDKTDLDTFFSTLFYDGNELRTSDGTEVSKDTITISANGEELDPETDYTIDGLDNLTPGNRTITFRGTNPNYCTGSKPFSTTIVVSRSNLKWSRTGTTTITLPYTDKDYILGSGLLSFENEASGGRISLDSTKDKVTITSNAETKTPTSANNFNTDATFKDQGTYTIKIEPQQPNDKTGSTELTLKILYDLSTAKVTYKTEDTSNAYALDGHHYNYNGKNPVVTSNVIVTTKSGQELKNGTDFSVPNPDTDATTTNGAGRYKLTIDAKSSSSYTFDDGTSSDPLTVTYYIDALSLTDSSKLTILLNKGAFSDEKRIYDGEEHIPDYADITVTYNDGTTEHTLTSEDYTIAVASGDWTNAGKHSIYIVGKGNYKGTSAIHEGTIVPFTLTKDNIKADDTVYNGGNEVKPNTIKVTMNSTGTPVTLKLHTNYEAEKSEGAENKKVGTTGKVDITGIGNYTGTVRGVEFQIVKLDLNNAETNLPLESRDYTGAEIDPTNQIVVYYTVDGDEHGGQLKLNTDFTVSYQLVQGTDVTPRDAGDYTVILTAVSSSKVVQAGTNKVVNDGFTINPISLNAHASEFAVEDAKYTGTSVRPKVTRNGVKVSNKDYTLSDWKNDVKPSSRYLGEMQKYYDGFSSDDLPSVTVTGKGNYTGKIKLNFGIGDAFDVVTATQTERAQYDGKEHPPVKGQNFTVRYKGKEVSADWYNIVDNDNDYVNGGVKTVTLEANRNAGGFYGTTTFEYTISPNATTVWGFSLDMDKNSNGEYAVEYQGAAVTPGVKVYTLDAGGNQTVLDKSEYKVEYSNNTKAGTASVKVTPNNYSADRCANDNPLTFRILGADITGSQFRVRFTDGLTRRQYTGSSISPAVRVTMLGSRATVTLTQGTDFTVSYKNNTNAGKATATVTGIGSYTGTVNLDYAIWTSLTDKTTTITVPKQMYTGEPITELKGVTIKAGGNNLVLDTDYSLVISSSDSFRTKGTAAFTGKGDYYEGTKTINFDIGNDASMYNVIGVSATYVFDHQAHKPVPVVTDKEGTVYPVDSVSYASTSDGDSCINAGNVRMQIAITSHGQTVSIPYNYTIERRDINTATFTPIADVDYNGKAHTPNVRVTEGTRLLTGTQTTSDGSADFTYTYYNNVQPGTATVTINGINNYTGIANLYFSINVKEAPQMKVTAMPSGRLKVSWNKVNGVSGYRIFYSPQGGSQKQVNIGSSKKTTYLTGLTRGVLYTVGLQSYVRANGQNGYSSASVQQIATSTSKPKITSAKSTGKGKIKLTWKKVSNATAYMVYRKTSGSKKWTRVKTTKNTSFTNTGLKSGRKYTYKVISYKQSGVKRSFSKYSKGKTVRAK